MNICNLCGSSKCRKELEALNTHGRHIVDAAVTFDYYRCLDCSNVFLTGVPVDADFYKRYYRSGYYGGSRRDTFSAKVEMLHRRYVVRARERMFARYLTTAEAKISILDVGCGSGDFLDLLDAGRFERSGIELNPEGVIASRARGLHIIEGDIRNTDLGAKAFDLVTLWHVLEHVQDPLSFLKRIKELKKTDGIAVIAVPNTDGLGFRIGKRWWFHLDAPRHLFLPNCESMTKLLAAAGFQIEGVECQSFEYPLDLFWSVRKSSAMSIVYPLYPVAKMASRETLVFAAR